MSLIFGEYIMKKNIHPEYYETDVNCACGANFKIHSIQKSLHVDICHNCHPFFTGKQKILDSAGRVDKFNKRYGIKKQ